MWNIYQLKNNPEFIDLDNGRSKNVLSELIKNYYDDVNKPIILDREKNWCHPANINMLNDIFEKKPKIVFTTRPIIEILASFIAIDKQSILKAMKYNEFKYNNDLSENDNICDYTMSPDGEFRRILDGFLYSIDAPENKNIIHIVKYEDLLDKPQDTMDGIYKFLEIDSFRHSFKNIVKVEKNNDAKVGYPKDLHKVRKVLGRSNIRVQEYLSPYAIEKYKDYRYF